MSCYEWEKGEWKLSCVEFRKLRDTLIEGYNKFQDSNLQVAGRLKAEFDRIRKNSEEFKATIKEAYCGSTRDPRAYSALFGILCRRLRVDECTMRNALMIDKKIIPAETPIEKGFDHFYSITKNGKMWRVYTKGRKFPKNPKKKDFAKATKATTHYNVGGDAEIYIDPEHRVVKWIVGENNHACEYAREHEMARVFWSAIGRVEWTRGTGGRLWGSDEYREDANREHGYSSDMTKQSWGNEKEARMRAFR